MSGKGNGCTCCVMMIVVLAAVSVGLAYYFTDGFQKPTDEALSDAGNAASDIGEKIKDTVNWDNLWPSLEHYFNEDPHRNVTGPGDADTWATSRAQPGLQLHVLNALTDDWHAFFEVAMSDWENGNPDVLTLSWETVTADFDCTAENQIDSVMKVCNGDYGDNGWRGLNTCIIVGGTIVSSVAQMNEFYLQVATDEWKQYTMCHEIGHGFGLPHTDEEFWNRDLGNCLDYTNNPRSSMHPDVANFNFLAQMYGSLDGTINAGSNLTAYEDDGGGDDQGEKIRQLLREQEEKEERQQQESSSSTGNILSLTRPKGDDDGSSYYKTPDWVCKSVKSIHEQLRRRRRLLLRQSGSSSSSSSSNGLISGGGGGETHHIDLGQGYSVAIYMLHADA